MNASRLSTASAIMLLMMSTLFMPVLRADFSESADALNSSEPAMPDFQLPGVEGELASEAFDGQVLLVNFFASWCGPCRAELPLLDAIHKRYERFGFAVVGINVDQRKKDGEKLLQDIPVSFPVGFDTHSELGESFGVTGMPTTVIVDRSGRVRHLHHGYQPGFEMTYVDQIKPLLRERSREKSTQEAH